MSTPDKINLSESQEYFKDYLRDTQNIPQDRLDPFKIPSLVNGKRVPATGIKSNASSNNEFYRKLRD